MPFTDGTGTTDLVERWPYDFQDISKRDPIYDYLTAYATELNRIDTFIDELYEQQNIQTATGRELEKLANEVNVARNEGESDDSLQYRALLGKAVSASDGTGDDFANILSIAFSEDKIQDIDVQKVADKPVIKFLIPGSYIDDIPIDAAELENELNRALPCGFGAIVQRSDSFEFGASGSKGLGNGKMI